MLARRYNGGPDRTVQETRPEGSTEMKEPRTVYSSIYLVIKYFTYSSLLKVMAL